MKIGPIVIIVQKHSTHQKTIKAVQDLSDKLKAEAAKLNSIVDKLNQIAKDN